VIRVGIIKKIKKTADALKNINVILQKQDEILKEQDNIFKKQDMIIDGALLERHKRRLGVYTSSDGSKLKSSVCRMQDLFDYNHWVNEMGTNLIHPHLPDSDCVFNRKAWEYVFIAQALHERDMLLKGKKGLGFAVGKEPLPSLFAKYGCEIVATDIGSSTEIGKKWANGAQHGDSANDLYKTDICDRDTFDKNVTFNFADMNAIPDYLTGFDFCWSSCAFEHLGSIKNGKNFIYNMMKCLKPGGIAVHTTEYNLSGYFGVMDNGGNAIFGHSDFIEMRNNLLEQGHLVEELDFRLGDYEEENYVSYPPYSKPHFKLWLDGNISTSFALIIRKAG
jgi:SAM-dependent methyltransferase